MGITIEINQPLIGRKIWWPISWWNFTGNFIMMSWGFFHGTGDFIGAPSTIFLMVMCIGFFLDFSWPFHPGWRVINQQGVFFQHCSLAFRLLFCGVTVLLPWWKSQGYDSGSEWSMRPSIKYWINQKTWSRLHHSTLLDREVWIYNTHKYIYCS